MDASPIRTSQAQPSLKKIENAYDIAYAFLTLGPSSPDVLREKCAEIEVLLLDLDDVERREKLIQKTCETLATFPALLQEQVCFLKSYAALFLGRAPNWTNHRIIIKAAATALAIDRSDSGIHYYLSRPFYFIALDEFERQLQRAAGLGDHEQFGRLLDTIPRLHQKFSTNNTDSIAYYSIARKIYRELKDNNLAGFAPFLQKILQGEETATPLNRQHSLTKIYQKNLELARDSFDSKEDPRTIQRSSFKTFCDFFIELFEDIFVILGEPPCKYDIRAMGSLARREFCPYSDFEYFILIEDEKHRAYFQKLAQIFDLQILALGETDPKHQSTFDFGQKFGLEIDHQSNPATKEDLISTPSTLFEYPADPNPDELKAFRSRCRSVSIHQNHSFDLPDFELTEIAKMLIKMRKNEAGQRLIGDECNIKSEFAEPLIHFLGDLGLYFNIPEANTLEMLDELPCFNATSKELLKFAVSKIYAIRVRIHLNAGGLQETAALEPNLDLPSLLDNEKDSLNVIDQFILNPLNQIDLEDSEIDLLSLVKISGSLSHAARCFQSASIDLNTRLYQRINTPDQIEHQAIYLKNTNPNYAKVLADIPNRAGYRLSRRFDEQKLAQSVIDITTEDPASGIKIRCPLFRGERYLKNDAVNKLLNQHSGHLQKHHQDSLHNVGSYKGLHFKEMPYQPLMEYAIHSLIHRIMGKATPATTLARIEIAEKRLAYPVLISETIEGKAIDPNSNFNQEHLTWLRLCEILTKPGDGRPSNYLVADTRVYCVDNDISFMPPIVQKTLGSQITFCSTPFTLDTPLDRGVLQDFCLLEPDMILTDWLQELEIQEEMYTSLFTDEKELEYWYTQDKKRSFTPRLLLSKGTIATLCVQFYRLQNALRQHSFKDAIELLNHVIFLSDTETISVGPLVEKAYRKALTKPYEKRLTFATGSKMGQSITSERAMKLNFKTVPTLKDIESKRYSLKEAQTELCLMEMQVMWNEVFVTKKSDDYAIEVDFSRVHDPEREKLILNALKHFNDASDAKPKSLSLRHTKTLTTSLLKPLLHPGLVSLDLSYGQTITNEVPLLLQLVSSPEGIGYEIFPPHTLVIQNQCPNLEKLHLEGCPNLKNFNLRLRKLTELNLSRCLNLREEGIDQMGRNLFDERDYKLALVYLRPALEIQKIQRGDTHENVAITLYSIGICHRKLNENVKADEFFNQAFGILESLENGRTDLAVRMCAVSIDHSEPIKHFLFTDSVIKKAISFNEALEKMNSLIELY